MYNELVDIMKCISNIRKKSISWRKLIGAQALLGSLTIQELEVIIRKFQILGHYHLNKIYNHM